jgi:invasion protein IalB
MWSAWRGEFKWLWAPVADLMNARYIGFFSLLVLPLGATLAIAQEGRPDVATAASAAGPASAAEGNPEAWVKLCHKNDETANRQICLIQHEGLDPNTGIMLATSAVSTIEGEEKQTLMVGVTTAYSLVIPAGVQIKIDDSDPVALKYTICGPMSCQAQMDLTKTTFDKIRKGKQMTVAAMNTQQKTMGFPVPLNGFAKAFDGPPVDNAKYEEAKRQTVEKLRRRQIELANKVANQKKTQGSEQPQGGAPAQP